MNEPIPAEPVGDLALAAMPDSVVIERNKTITNSLGSIGNERERGERELSVGATSGCLCSLCWW